MTSTRQFGMRIVVAADPPMASLVFGILHSAPAARSLFLQDLAARGLRPVPDRPVVVDAWSGEELPHRRTPYRVVDLLVSAHVEEDPTQ